jgi:hypothetical protein
MKNNGDLNFVNPPPIIEIWKFVYLSLDQKRFFKISQKKYKTTMHQTPLLLFVFFASAFAISGSQTDTNTITFENGDCLGEPNLLVYDHGINGICSINNQDKKKSLKNSCNSTTHVRTIYSDTSCSTVKKVEIQSMFQRF